MTKELRVETQKVYNALLQKENKSKEDYENIQILAEALDADAKNRRQTLSDICRLAGILIPAGISAAIMVKLAVVSLKAEGQGAFWTTSIARSLFGRLNK